MDVVPLVEQTQGTSYTCEEVEECEDGYERGALTENPEKLFSVNKLYNQLFSLRLNFGRLRRHRRVPDVTVPTHLRQHRRLVRLLVQRWLPAE